MIAVEIAPLSLQVERIDVIADDPIVHIFASHQGATDEMLKEAGFE